MAANDDNLETGGFGQSHVPNMEATEAKAQGDTQGCRLSGAPTAEATEAMNQAVDQRAGSSDTPGGGETQIPRGEPVTTDGQDTQRELPSNENDGTTPVSDIEAIPTSAPQERSGASLGEAEAGGTSSPGAQVPTQGPALPTLSVPGSPECSQSGVPTPAPAQPTPPALGPQSGQQKKTNGTAAISPPKPDSPPPPIQLPNATVNKAYKCNILKGFNSPADLIDVTIDNLENTGLTYDAEHFLLEGTPTIAGEFLPVLRYRSKKQSDQSRYIQRALALIINADPKSLWKDIPSDKSDRYWKPESDSKSLMRDRLLIGASQRGRSHAHEGSFRDDDFELAYLESGWYLAAVADGAGSSKSSRKGSQIVCSCAIDHLKTNIDRECDERFESSLADYAKDPTNELVHKSIKDKVYTLLAGAAHLGFKMIQEEARAHGVPPKDYATTLIVAAIRRYDYGWFVGAYWVGDGGIGIYSRNSEVRLLGEPDGGEFAGQTRFITMPEVWDATEIYRRIRFELVDDFTSVVLMTDGITDAKFESENNLKLVDRWDGLWDDLTRSVPFGTISDSLEKDLLNWLSFWSPGNHDDRTIAILV